MKHLYNFLLAMVALIILMSAIAFSNEKNELPNKHLEVVLRNIGHQLLLKSGDSTSRVLPITKINGEVYQISFEHNFGFSHDTLMSLVQQQLAKTNEPKDYIVSVNECNKNKTVFAYEINAVKGDLKACNGRVEEKGCYMIQIAFLPGTHFNYLWILMTILSLATIVYFIHRLQRKKENKEQVERQIVEEENFLAEKDNIATDDLEYIALGKFRFFDKKGYLNLNDVKIDLSDKEVKALSIFASNKNLVVERVRLRKELWEDEGVFVIDRNVDVLVSKLRKKLIDDPSIKIVNVPGKGYKFIV